MRKILKHFIKNYFDKKLPIIEGSAKLKENKGESLLLPQLITKITAVRHKINLDNCFFIFCSYFK